tara:strand:+ start:22 stop:636 length:615 start_codon:yes stop_codon:yes gene_type:complete
MTSKLEYSKKELEHKFAEDFSNSTFPLLADLYFSEHDFERARQVCEIGLKHQDDNLDAQYILAKIELIEGNSIKSERILKSIYNLDPSFIKAIKLLIEVRDSLNRSKVETKKIIDYLLSNAADDIFAHQWLNNNQDNLNNNTDTKIDTFRINENIISFTFYEVLKHQKYYQQAISILNDLKTHKKIESKLYKKEIDSINKLISK